MLGICILRGFLSRAEIVFVVQLRWSPGSQYAAPGSRATEGRSCWTVKLFQWATGLKCVRVCKDIRGKEGQRKLQWHWWPPTASGCSPALRRTNALPPKAASTSGQWQPSGLPRRAKQRGADASASCRPPTPKVAGPRQRPSPLLLKTLFSRVPSADLSVAASLAMRPTACRPGEGPFQGSSVGN